MNAAVSSKPRRCSLQSYGYKLVTLDYIQFEAFVVCDVTELLSHMFRDILGVLKLNVYKLQVDFSVFVLSYLNIIAIWVCSSCSKSL